MVTGGQLDDVDVVLLRELQRDARVSQGALGARVGLSAAAVNRRIRRLTDDGYIERTTTVLSASRLGHPITVVVEVELLSEEAGRVDEFQAAMVASPNVQQCYYVTGEWDFILVLLVTDMDQYRQLTRQLLYASGNVRRFRTLVAMDRAKVTLDVALTDG